MRLLPLQYKVFASDKGVNRMGIEVPGSVVNRVDCDDCDMCHDLIYCDIHYWDLYGSNDYEYPLTRAGCSWESGFTIIGLIYVWCIEIDFVIYWYFWFDGPPSTCTQTTATIAAIGDCPKLKDVSLSIYQCMDSPSYDCDNCFWERFYTITFHY